MKGNERYKKARGNQVQVFPSNFRIMPRDMVTKRVPKAAQDGNICVRHGNVEQYIIVSMQTL